MTKKRSTKKKSRSQRVQPIRRKANKRKSKKKTNSDLADATKSQIRQLQKQLKLNVVADQSVSDDLLFVDVEGQQPAVIRSLVATGNDVQSFAAADGTTDFYRSADIHTLEISRVRTLASLDAYSSKLKKLRVLRLSWPLFAATTTANIEPLSGLTGLRELQIWNCRCKNLTALSSMLRLRTFEFGGDDANFPLNDISALSECENLTELHLTITKVNSFQPLSHLAKLKTLVIRHSPVEDLKPLRKLSNLRSLTFYWSAACDLKPLRGLEKLKYLEIMPGDHIDPAQLNRLAKKIPKCKFHVI